MSNEQKVNLTLNKPNKSYYTVRIKADWRDADYITTFKKYSEESFNEVALYLKFMVNNLIGRRKLFDYIDDDSKDTDFYNALIEYVDLYWFVDRLCHTIEEVEILYYDTDGKCYKVSFDN